MTVSSPAFVVRSFLRVSALLLGVSTPLAVRAADDPTIQFERDVRPILENRCFECHGPEKHKGGLRLDLESGMRNGGESGEPAIVPGKSTDSALLKHVTSSDPDEAMPPKGDRLTPEQVAVLKRWIDSGAHFPASKETVESAPLPPSKAVTDADRQFWCFRPLQKTEPVFKEASSWPRTRIDRFILAQLQEHSLTPSPETSRLVWLRRATFDLTGLPPTPEETDAFLNDSSPNAFEKVTDRLLASQRFGERMASFWLPLARYAEDQAHQVGRNTSLAYPNAYLYRAWVIDAFNRDLPYDDFVRLQLAADKMESCEPDSLVALGFLGLGPKYYAREQLAVMADEWEDRIDTISRTMLGLTVACARCHDHKFDPISTRDYYALAGVFASTRMVNRMPDGHNEKDSTKADQMSLSTLHIVEDGEPKDLHVFVRGNADRQGPLVERRFLEILTPQEPVRFTNGSGRLDLAEAIVRHDNPLTARVMVNRIWGLLFGQPIVPSPSNFGHSGMTPSHPELLDDLALRFMDQGWSIKKLMREIVLSATYRQSSANDSQKAVVDAGNRLLWRMNRRRLSVEQWRDSLLFTSGELLENLGGKSQDLDDPNLRVRTLYARVSRLKLNDLLAQFDYPDANVHAEKRSVTTTPIQKLFVLNSAFMQRRARALAELLHGDETSDEEQIRRAYQILYSRPPKPRELTLALDFLSKPSNSEMSRWEQYAQLLFASNEMFYVD